LKQKRKEREHMITYTNNNNDGICVGRWAKGNKVRDEQRSQNTNKKQKREKNK
jgi:hypothetical protein